MTAELELSQEEQDLLFALADTKKGRAQFIESISFKHELNWQEVSTPYDICREMCDLVSDVTHFAVLFSMEFLEILVKEREVPPQNIIFFGDNEIEAKMAGHERMYGVNTRYLDKNELASDGLDCDKLAQQLNEGINTMRFEKLAVVMNPPYQMSDGGHSRSAKPIYHRFIETIIDGVQPNYLVSINPSRWMLGGKGLDKFRQRMMTDRRIKVIVDDMSPSGIFTDVDIAGGVNYFLWDKENNGKCLFNGIERYLDEEDIVLRENESRSILQKVKNQCEKWIGDSASPRKPYGLSGNVKPEGNGVPCWFKQSIGLAFVKPSKVMNPRNDVDSWRVLVPYAPIAGQTDFTKPIAFFNDRNVVVAKPGEYCAETYIVLKSFDNKKQSENFVSYLKTRFFRFMLRMRVVSQHITREKYNWVPDLEDYSSPWTDEELYDMFNLTRQEQSYIESKIKPLDEKKKRKTA